MINNNRQTKVWCLHCETVTLCPVEKQDTFPNNYFCSNCLATCIDVQYVFKRNGFFKQVYPNIKYEDIEINKVYPLYP